MDTSAELTLSETLRVLVVDDDRDGATSLGILAELWGHRALVCFGAADALAEAPAFRPHVVLCDIGLPRMDGFELAGRLRRQLGREVVLIAVTGYGDRAHRSRWEPAFDHYLVKPAALAEVKRLLGTVKKAIGLPSGAEDTVAAAATVTSGKKKSTPALHPVATTA